MQQRKFAWPGPLADMDPPQRNLTLALGVSILLHAVVLSVHFKLPHALGRATEQALDVILVNSKSARKPSNAQARAQANLDGGGNTDENRRAATPLPPTKASAEGSELVEKRQRVARMEAEQKQILTRLQSERSVSADKRRNEPVPAVPPNISGVDLAGSALAAVRLEGQIARNIEEYNKRPRRAFIGARTTEYRFAQYVEDWRQKVERIGNLNYPDSARGKLYGSLVISVVINSNGELQSVVVDRPSGHKVLDDAARRIVQLAAPYSPFPPAIKRDTDIIEITRTWTFTNADRLSAN